ncbi:molybdenum cofactor cytidylyltransferase [Anaeromicrobium sediminis]|uniref:Molybdenum cofactor cytidylyltransferase n=1 Tax=Anaeromicrobium sediminis TaxID=1478221 RepID=A0A267MIA5_9FIRM|nr:molybdenum cofactor cytidylyltransferase [Anaeromicrobium sediminis]PAB59309.1 molybdenum cofactor cytidylyltransferase [Anaeromicrobium sediminis]
MISTVILASGKSTRMGKNKLLLPFKEHTIIEEVIDNSLKSNSDEIILVYKDRTIGEIGKNKGIKTIYNSEYEKGQSTSVKKGLGEVSPNSQGILFVLGDMPLIHEEIMNKIINTFKNTKKTIIVPLYNGKRGNPVLFHRKWKNNIMDISGDHGPRKLIMENPNEIEYVHIYDCKFNLDVDSKGDYERVKMLIEENKSI